ncbi:MAG: putative zinc-binding metallopeptidase [Methylotenera sp.]|nr:putative zinc-binding metallopeptidase [Oligoflexia bacterium]
MAKLKSKSMPGLDAAEWSTLKDEELLKLKICDLGLKIEGSELESRIQSFHAELETRGFRFKPKVYLGDEWFSPEGMVAIAVPFYLAHPRLIALEKKLMFEVEGDDPEYFKKLIRHEAGHCFDHAYRFSPRKRWRELFGPPNQEYAPETYRPRPHSKSFVRHLDNWYAQAHPDEDFAETFAVWLTSSGFPVEDAAQLAQEGQDGALGRIIPLWKAEYAHWPVALSKLEYVDELVKSVRNKEPGGEGGYLPFSASRMKTTLEHYYNKKRKERAEEYPDFYDPDLKRIFDGAPELSKREHGAAVFMKRHRKIIVESVSHWSGERKYTVHKLIDKVTTRCEKLELKTGKSETQTSLEVAAYLATLVTNYLFTGKFKRTV